jgi:hypothetical protein
LSGFESEHDHDSSQQTESVRNQVGPEEDARRLGFVGFVTSVEIGQIVAKHQSDEDTGDDNVTQTQHGGSQLRIHLREDQLDGSIEALGHGDHDFSAKDPPNVVEEQAPLRGRKTRKESNERWKMKQQRSSNVPTESCR